MSFVLPAFVPKDNGMVYDPYYELVATERDDDPKKVKGQGALSRNADRMECGKLEGY